MGSSGLQGTPRTANSFWSHNIEDIEDVILVCVQRMLGPGHPSVLSPAGFLSRRMCVRGPEGKRRRKHYTVSTDQAHNRRSSDHYDVIEVVSL